MRSKSLQRHRKTIAERDGVFTKLKDKTVIDFTSNDYLQLAQHPYVKESFIEGVKKFGAGSGASSVVSGFHTPHQQLEEAFAEFLKRDRALLFNSGYHANLGVITTLAKKHDKIIADKLCHASIIDGILLSRLPYKRYRHQDHQHAKSFNFANAMLITESVFSMEGSITPLNHFADISATLIVDDAHGVGVLGKNGAGISELFPDIKIDCLVTPLGKALGSCGAIVSGSHEMIEEILQFSRSYFYSTALPPAVSYATLTALKVLQDESFRRTDLATNIQYFIDGCKQRGISLISEDKTPIKSILIGDNQKTCDIQDALLEKNIFVSSIRPPTVPKNSARIRISLSSAHTTAHIDQLLDEYLCIQK